LLQLKIAALAPVRRWLSRRVTIALGEQVGECGRDELGLGP
jgi:hypothetical protein